MKRVMLKPYLLMKKIMADNSKEIIALSDFEHVIERPTMYVGSVKASEEKISIVKAGRIVVEQKEISVGFYKLINEILDNAVDEAVRLKGKMKSIRVYFTFLSLAYKTPMKPTKGGEVKLTT